MICRRRASVGLLLVLTACGARDAETDEAAIASDSAAAAAPIVVPASDSASAATTGRSGLRPPPGPTDRNPSVPRRTSPGGGILSDASLDTARGVIALVGADPMIRVTLRGDPGGTLTLIGAPALSTLSGLELWIAGRRRDGVYEVKDFAVRAAEGVPALDGVLAERAGVLSLVHSNGDTTAIAGAPAAIRPFIGKRVWVTVTNGEVQTFGVIGGPP